MSGLVTLCLLAIMVKGVIMGRGQRVEILVVPVSALFAFTSLRDTMPGAPGSFGTPTVRHITYSSFELTCGYSQGAIIGMYHRLLYEPSELRSLQHRFCGHIAITSG